jgi:hypothetical protein
MATASRAALVERLCDLFVELGARLLSRAALHG